jgi:hypothetical protein
MTLPIDVPRCAGRYDFDPDGEWCPERMSCERYLAWADRYKNTLTPDYRGISCSMAVRDCEHKIEVSENAD